MRATTNAVDPPTANIGAVPIKTVPAIYRLLIEAKKRIGAVRKEGKYDGGSSGSYHFRGVDQVTNAVAPIFNDLGILGPSPTVLEAIHEVHENVRKDGSISKAYRHILRVQYTFVAAEDGSSWWCVVEGESIDYSDKGTAQAMSVALRIALLQTLTLPTDDLDPDAVRPEITTPSVSRETPREVEPPADKEHREALLAVIDGLDEPDKALLAVFCRGAKVPSLRKTGATLTQINEVHDYIATLTATDVAQQRIDEGSDVVSDNATAAAAVRQQIAPQGDDNNREATQ